MHVDWILIRLLRYVYNEDKYLFYRFKMSAALWSWLINQRRLHTSSQTDGSVFPHIKTLNHHPLIMDLTIVQFLCPFFFFPSIRQLLRLDALYNPIIRPLSDVHFYLITGCLALPLSSPSISTQVRPKKANRKKLSGWKERQKNTIKISGDVWKIGLLALPELRFHEIQ